VNRFLVANILVALTVSGCILWGLWSCLSFSMLWKIVCSILIVLFSAFFEERCLSRFINGIVGRIGRKANAGKKSAHSNERNP